MKKIIIAALILFVLIFAGYIALMTVFQGGISADISGQAQLDVQERHLTLPWYLRMGAREWARIEGSDESGTEYTRFLYELPSVFESTDMECVVIWDAASVHLYICESRSMNYIEQDYPFVSWN